METQSFDIATKIVESFVNPTIGEGKITSAVDELSDSLNTSVNTIWDTGKNWDGHEESRFRFIVEKGVANIDKSEEATTRLDNLPVAREMENYGKDARTVKMATGWERGADRKWGFRTDPKNGNNIVVAIRTNVPKQRYGKQTIQINDIRSLYPKDNMRDIVNWINRGDLLTLANKEKLLDWITQQRSNSAEVAIPSQELNVVTKIVESFVNPTIGEGKSPRLSTSCPIA